MSGGRNTANSLRTRIGGIASLNANPPPLPLPQNLEPANPPAAPDPDPDPPPPPGGGSGDGGDADNEDGDSSTMDDPDRPPHIPRDRWIEFQGLGFAVSNAIRQNQSLKHEKPIKPRDPDRFDGSDPTLLEEFLFQCGLVFGHSPKSFANDSNKILYALQWLKGTAQCHFRNSFNLPDDQKPEFYQDWGAFVNELQDNFGELDRTGTAVSQILALKMQEHHKVLHYKVEFEELAARTNWDTASLRDHFYTGLAERIKDAIASSPAGKSSTLTGLKHQALAFDTRYWERKAEISRSTKSGKTTASNTNSSVASHSHSHSHAAHTSTSSQRPSRTTDSSSNRHSHSHSPSHPSSSTSGRQNVPKNTARTPSSSNSNAQMPANRSSSKPNLEGKVGKDGRLTEDERQRRKDGGLCLYCEDKGHLVVDCPLRKSKEEAKARRAAAASGSQPQPPLPAPPAKN